MNDPTATLIELALAEDIGPGDVTADYFIPAENRSRAFVTVRGEGVVSGITIAAEVFQRVDPGLEVEILIEDGSRVTGGALLMCVEGSTRAIVTAERSALNFVQRLSGIATLTSRYVERVADTTTRILDTRKTTPGYRLLEKRAVTHGGGSNHRLGLYDRAMVKDNHLAARGDLEALQAAITLLRNDHPEIEIELEADRPDQVRAFLGLDGVDHILLDNMSLDHLREAVALRGTSRTPMFEASGGVTLETVRDIAETGVDFISVGAITHSAPALDIALDFAAE
jgi:nicotinate-nucleotide pyrophosphorylase (carboxylating)